MHYIPQTDQAYALWVKLQRNAYVVSDQARTHLPCAVFPVHRMFQLAVNDGFAAKLHE